MTFWTKFRKDRNFLIPYLAAHLVVAIAVVSWQWQHIDIQEFLNPVFNWKHLWLLPFGAIIAVQIPVLIHNCVHGNVKPRWMNIVLGELAGVYVLLSLASFELNHVMHHAHADSEHDPHNPHERNFFGFFFANNFGGTDVVLAKYLKFHGDTFANRLRFKAIIVLHFLNVPLRLLFWLFLLGPSLFVIFFLPSYLFHMFVFAHINYVTHETFEDGTAVVYNLDSNWYYRFVNFFGSGVYYHKNHHNNPNHYNPRDGANKSFWPVR